MVLKLLILTTVFGAKVAKINNFYHFRLSELTIMALATVLPPTDLSRILCDSMRGFAGLLAYPWSDALSMMLRLKNSKLLISAYKQILTPLPESSTWTNFFGYQYLSYTVTFCFILEF